MRRRKYLAPSTSSLDSPLLSMLGVLFLLAGSLLAFDEFQALGIIRVQPPPFCDLGAPVDERAELPLQIRIQPDGFAVSQQRTGGSFDEIPIHIPLSDEATIDSLDFRALTAVVQRMKSPTRLPGEATIIAHGQLSLQGFVSTIDAIRGDGCSTKGLTSSTGAGETNPKCLYPYIVVRSLPD